MSELPLSEIDSLCEEVAVGEIKVAKAWQGADVKVLGVNETYSNPKGSFYPDERLLRTTYVGEVSWLFEQLRDIVNKIEGYGYWKEEFFGRITNVANEFLNKNKIDVSHGGSIETRKEFKIKVP